MKNWKFFVLEGQKRGHQWMGEKPKIGIVTI